MKFYPDAAKYYWKVHLIVFDEQNRKAMVIFLEVMLFRYVERNRQKEDAKK